MHEMVLGTMDDLKKHAQMMHKHPGMEHDEPYMAHVAPGKTETIVWTFTKARGVPLRLSHAGPFRGGHGWQDRRTLMPSATIIVAPLEGGTPVRQLIAALPQRSCCRLANATSHGSGVETQASLTDGEVRKVDKEAKKITIRHGPIANLDMPPMTMVFQVQHPAMLDAIKVGDKVRFIAEKAGGAFTVTHIESVK